MLHLCEKRRSKKCFKKRCPARRKLEAICGSGGSRRRSLARALFRQETIVRATVEALFEILAEKSELDSKSLNKRMDGWKFENKFINSSNIMSIVAEKTQANIATLVETIVETNATSWWSDTPWARPGEYRCVCFVASINFWSTRGTVACVRWRFVLLVLL